MKGDSVAIDAKNGKDGVATHSDQKIDKRGKF